MNNYNDFLDLCDEFEEREFSVWMDADADLEEPIDEYTEGG